jgi:hypothetical protein
MLNRLSSGEDMRESMVGSRPEEWVDRAKQEDFGLFTRVR